MDDARTMAVDPPRGPSGRRGNGCSVVFSVRLDPTELAALEGRAASAGIALTVLARNLIRIGLTPGSADVSAAIRRAESALADVSRALHAVPAR